MQVRDAMSSEVLTVGPRHTLREAARRMAQRRVGAAVILDSDSQGIGIITERDILLAVADGEDVDTERVESHLTTDLVFAAPQWSLEQAATTMVRRGFRHLIVTDGGEVVGMLSVRDIVRCWSQHGGLPLTAVG